MAPTIRTPVLTDAAVLAELPVQTWRVAEQNPRAIAFYRRNGFAFDGVEQVDPASLSIIDARMVR